MSGLRRRHQESKTSVATNTRAVSNLVGFILLFSILLLALAGYQAQVVPQETAQTEFEHHQIVQSDLIGFRNAIFETATDDQSVFRSGGTATSIQLGTIHKSRILTVGPPSSAGALRTSESYNVTVQNTRTNRTEKVPTRFVEYSPQYTEYRVGSIWYENSMLYLDERERSANPIILADQQLAVDGRAIRPIATQNEISENGISTTTIEQYAADAVERNPELFEAETRRMRIALPTRLNTTEYWGDELNNSVQYTITEDAYEAGVHELELLVKPDIEINTVGFQSGPTENPLRSPTDVEREFSTPNSEQPADLGAVVDGMEGDGTDEDPYVITTDEELQSIDANESTRAAHYRLGTNIDASDTDEWNDNNGFDPIGLDDEDPFTGSLDGNGYAVVGLTVDRDSNDSVGLFSEIEEAPISNIGLETVDITGKDEVGGLVGHNDGGHIEATYVSGDVVGGNNVGGLVGKHADANIYASYATADVAGDDNVGGLVGENRDMIRQSHATGVVMGDSNAGGLVGENRDMIRQSHATGDVGGVEDVGGLVGKNHGNSATINTAYATGDVAGDDNVGGLVGENSHNRAAIDSSYATGDVDGTDDDTVGGLVGSTSKNADIDDSYWDRGTTNQEDGIGNRDDVDFGTTGFGETGDGTPAKEMIGGDALDDGNMDGFSENDWRELEHPDDYPLLG